MQNGNASHGGLLHGTAVAFLAGGASSRMGTPKAMLEINGETFLARLARTFTGFDERLLSANDSAITAPGLRRIVDIRPGLGPIGGLYSVLRSCRSERVLFIPCDMPLLTMDIALRLLRTLGDGDACIAEVGGAAEPLGAVYAKSALPAMEACIAARSYRLRTMLAMLDCRRVAFDDEQSRMAFSNINTPEELQNLLKLAEGKQ